LPSQTTFPLVEEVTVMSWMNRVRKSKFMHVLSPPPKLSQWWPMHFCPSGFRSDSITNPLIELKKPLTIGPLSAFVILTFFTQQFATVVSASGL
jgi:hypothetical protein